MQRAPSDEQHVRLTPIRSADGDGGPVAPLRRPLTSFVGREREITAVRDLLRREEVRLVTLLGPGGVGKTRLAIEVADAVAPDFAGDVVFVPLAPFTDPDLVARAIVQALGARMRDDRDIVARLIGLLRDRRVLLVLDNFEQVSGGAPLLVELLVSCPDLRIVVTSRATLHLSGEQTFPVSPLAVPDAAAFATTDDVARTDAVRLFAIRARAAVPTFAVDDGNAADVASICRRLDGLPLAIELAAARISVLPPPALLTRLARRLPLLTGGPHDLPARLRTMRDAIAWSYDLLAPEEQTLFCRLAVFVGGFTLDAADAVGGGAEGRTLCPSVFDGIVSLVNKSLLQRTGDADGDPRFEMLETIREFAQERLAAGGEGDEIRRRHAAFFLDLAERSEIAPFLVAGHLLAARFVAEHANLRVALTWLDESGDAAGLLRLAGALNSFFKLTGQLREGRGWLERAVARRAAASDSATARGLLGLANMLHYQGEADLALAACEDGLGLARAAADAYGVFFGLSVLGLISRRRGDLARAETAHTEALTVLSALGEEPWVTCAASSVLGHLGSTAVARGDVDGADALFAKALDRQRSLGYAVGTSHVIASHPLAGLGDVARARGDHAAALAVYQDALGMAHRFGDSRAIAYTLGGVAGTLAAAGCWRQAARLFGADEALHAAAGLHFDLETMDQQRALGLPEPWLRGGDSFGSGQRLRDARLARSARPPAAIPDRELAARLWAEGRSLPKSDAIAEALAARLASAPAADANGVSPAGLTPRELDVLRLLAAGQSDREIGETLFISPRTVMTHAQHIFGKLGVRTRKAAVTFARERGLV